MGRRAKQKGEGFFFFFRCLFPHPSSFFFPFSRPPFLSGQADVFEEVPTMDFPFHGMPTVPPRKDMSHMVRER